MKKKASLGNRFHRVLRKIVYCTLILIVLLAGFCLWWSHGNSSVYRHKLLNFLQHKLISIDPIPRKSHVKVIYVLGGSQRDLDSRFKKAAEIYDHHTIKKILILSRPGKTAYSRNLGRNLTNDEWSFAKLKKMGINGSDIELVEIKKGFFGTLSEAKHVSALVRTRGWKSIILITSPYHTLRTRISFEKFLRADNVTLYVLGSAQRGTLRELIVEFIKINVYKWL